MSQTAIQQIANDPMIRAEQIFHLGLMCRMESWPDLLAEAFRDLPEVWREVGLKEGDLNDPEDLEEIACALYGRYRLGFLICFATPVPQKAIYGGTFSYSWGVYQHEWVYADTLEEACKKRLDRSKAFVEEERERLKKERQIP
ncbi:MAG: hypothetical protein HQL72_02180 [Magnetococcales bacterium]|nr:hypothetical protein [Magnetococcales bacterium]